jgi:membrane-bound lytic murein transglycosylase D
MAQPTFYLNQNKIFSELSSNWICKNLHEVNPKHFQCGSEHSWTLPVGHVYPFLDLEIKLSQQDIQSFNELVFPNQTCSRYLDVVAMCDLYFPLYKKQIRDKSMHEDYVFLPLLLSGNNQNFKSADDKSGLWAMDYLAARKLHLRIDSLVDERNGGDFTTKAALAYLGELSLKYNNDHAKVIMAYVKGVPFVARQTTPENNTGFYSSLSSEDQLIFKLGAYMKALIGSTRTANQLQTCFDIFAQSETVRFENPVQFDALVAVLGIDAQLTRSMNAVYTGSTIPAAYLKVPFMLDKVAALKYEAFADSIYRWKPAAKPDAFESVWDEEVITYKVKKGDSLGKIANKYHVSVKQIKSWNKLKGDKISKGQVLKIHVRKKIRKEKPKTEQVVEQTPEIASPEVPQVNSTYDMLANSNQLMLQGKYAVAQDSLLALQKTHPNHEGIKAALETCETKLKQQPKKNLPPQEKQKITHVVKSGESLWSIAKKYKGVTEQDIMKWNKCSDKIRPGQKLLIYPKK